MNINVLHIITKIWEALKFRILTGLMLLALILAGCSNEATAISKGWNVTPAIDLKTTNEKGEEITVKWMGELGGSNWGAQASHPSTMTLPTLGLWKLDAFVENKLYGTIIVKVQ